ncbi:MAG: diacylglycerol O-acyltransferase [Halioglobus sp.]|jgi:diacylglycerol O-acyltransferase
MSRIVKNIPIMDLMSYLLESVDSPTHVGFLQIFKPVHGSSSEVVQRVLKAYRTKAVGPPFNYYPVFSRFSMPKWAEAEEFDTAYHIRHAAVPQPGRDRQLIDRVMDLHAGMMDRSRPGWIAYVIEGLENDCFAVYWKVHHAYIDGASAIMRLNASMSRTSDDLDVIPLWGPLFEPSKPKKELTLSDLLAETGQGIATQAKVMREIAQALTRSIKQARGQLERESPLPFSAPKSLYNKPVYATRNLGVGATSIDRFIQIAKKQKVSVNEVALTIIGAALDRYGESNSQTTDKQLVAACPMAVRKEGDTDASTQIAAIQVKLGNSSMSIRQRLDQVAASSRDAKAEAAQMSREALMGYLVLLGGAATMVSKTALGDYIPPISSVNVSNVAGPRHRCYLSGAEMIRSYPLSTLAGGTAINITLASLSGEMTFAVIADTKAVPNTQQIADFMLEALDELEIASDLKKNVPPIKRKVCRKKSRPKNTL